MTRRGQAKHIVCPYIAYQKQANAAHTGTESIHSNSMERDTNFPSLKDENMHELMYLFIIGFHFNLVKVSRKDGQVQKHARGKTKKLEKQELCGRILQLEEPRDVAPHQRPPRHATFLEVSMLLSLALEKQDNFFKIFLKNL